MKKLSAEEIHKTEQELGVVLPTLYRTLLQEIGYGQLDRGRSREIYHPSQIAGIYEDVFDDPDWLFNIYFPFGSNERKQDIWVIDVRREKAATIWHESHPDDWCEMEWLPYEQWRETYLNNLAPLDEYEFEPSDSRE
jgi:hypothetical protein